MGIGFDSYNHETYGLKTISIFQKVFPNRPHPNSNLPQSPNFQNNTLFLLSKIFGMAEEMGS